MAEPLIAAVGGRVPAVDPSAFVAPNAVVVGDVTVGAGASVWYGAVLRGDAESISVGAGSNIQDNCTLHADPGFPLVVGERISVGHNAVLHGCTVEDDVLVGMNATVLNGARIGAGSLVAAGAVVPQGMVVPPGSLVAGVPAKVRRELSEDERTGIKANGEGYQLLAGAHREITGN
ncbi:carbonic anhydrase/acetyltransferase-like protein (isoleucine patch superfamily) [Streptomyces sp. 1114.5]|uniref:gamma carbonic anhydrase family protein n=1 Tax=Streptomyces sp. 1114.5 TaxID=1938830 RepID=UPI000EAFBF2C|nr:gamma carbonic anhydrase family protein [Streptomyces sp. 1114.5]RKT19721.1 carbonic anhydrase/acetyltransferase-like protein (isoleucine patch superfamily) [Streptomyces sp. 1114.5]